jgi:hypothetical protein
MVVSGSECRAPAFYRIARNWIFALAGDQTALCER